MKDLDLKRGPIAWMTRNSVAANLLMIFFLVGGLILGLNTKQEVFPESELDIINITVPYPGASPVDVEEGILLPIEEKIRGLDGVKKVTSTANENSGNVSVELILGTNKNKALQDIKNEVDRIVSFPEDAERPIVSMASTQREVLSLIIYGNYSEKILRDIAEMSREDLLARKGITQVELSGIKPLEIRIEVPQKNLRKYGLTIQQIAELVRQTSIELPGGEIKAKSGNLLLRTDEKRDFGREYGNIPVISLNNGTIIYLKDISVIKDGFEDIDRELLFNGKNAVKIDVYRVGKEGPIEVSNDVKKYMTILKQKVPEKIGMSIWLDRSEIFYQRIDLLLRNGRWGLFLVLIILALFLEIRLAFWVTLGIPISILGSFIFTPIADVTINMISLFAFIVTLGIIVDDAIVVGENIYEMREKCSSYLEASIRGAKMVAVPVVFSILTNIAAFIPLCFVPGMMGKFFKVIPFVVIPVFTISLIESLVILPAHLSHKPKNFVLFNFIGKIQNTISIKLNYLLHKIYEPLINITLSWRYVSLALSVFVLLVTMGFIKGGHIDFNFMPSIESDAVIATAVLPYESNIEKTKKIQKLLYDAGLKILDKYGGKKILRGIYTQIGGRSPGFGPHGILSLSSSTTSVNIFMVPVDQRPVTASQFAKEWKESVGDIPGLESLTFKYKIGPGASSAIDIELSHTDISILEQASSELAEALHSYNGLKDINDGFEKGKPQFNFRLRPEARSLGLTVSSIGRQIRNAFYGAEALRLQRGRNEVKVLVKRPENERISAYNIDELIITTPSGGEIALRDAVYVDKGMSNKSIKRIDGRRTIDVTADIIEGKANAEKVLSDLRKTVLPKLMQDYPGLQYSFAGEHRDISESMSSLFRGFLLALLAIYAMLAVPFKSYFQPIIVMIAIPFGIIGAVIGHVIMGYELSVISMFGIVALSGVVVNDSLVLIHTANENLKSGMPVRDAIKSAAKRRLRPIILTSVTTFGGLAPMIFETSIQARFLIPMAISLGYGIIFSTVIALLLIPALYLILEDIKDIFKYLF